MKGLLISFLATLGLLTASFSSQACAIAWIDEEECPKSLIK